MSLEDLAIWRKKFDGIRYKFWKTNPNENLYADFHAKNLFHKTNKLSV